MNMNSEGRWNVERNKENNWSIAEAQKYAYGTGTEYDGFFVAHTYHAAKALYWTLLIGQPCAAVALSGHDETPEGVEPPDRTQCSTIKGLSVVYPLDKDGYGLLSGVDMRPTIEDYQEMLESDGPRCVRPEPQWDPRNPNYEGRVAKTKLGWFVENDGLIRTPAAEMMMKDEFYLCFGRELMLIHAIKDPQAMAEYYDATYKNLLLRRPHDHGLRGN